MKLKKRYIVFGLLILWAIQSDMPLSAIAAFFIFAAVFYGFYLIWRQERVRIKKEKNTQSQVAVQVLQNAKSKEELINWQFQSIRNQNTAIDLNEVGNLLLFCATLGISLMVIKESTNLIVLSSRLLVIGIFVLAITKFYKKWIKEKQLAKFAIVETFELTPNYLIYSKNNTVQNIDWQAILDINYAQRGNLEPSAIEIIFENQPTIVIEQKLLNEDIYITMDILKNYWYLYAKGRPLPKIT